MEKSRSVYRRGAEDGLKTGPVMALAVFLSGATGYEPWLAIPALIALGAVPVLEYFMLRASFRRDGCKTTFSALWLQGICGFFFGSLLMGAAVLAILRWGYPTYITDQMHILADMFAASPDESSIDYARAINHMIETGTGPTATDLALELMYLTVFLGSLLSMVLSALVRGRRRPTPPPFNEIS